MKSRRYQYRLMVSGYKKPLEIFAFSGEEAFSRPFCYTIDITHLANTVTARQLMMKPATLMLQAPAIRCCGANWQTPQREIHGIITCVHQLADDQNQYQICLQPRLLQLAGSDKNQLYHDCSVPEVVQQILSNYRFKNGQQFIFKLEKEYKKHKTIKQQQDDLSFISRLLAEHGIWFRFLSNPYLKIDTVIFYDHQRHESSPLSLPNTPENTIYKNGHTSVWGLSHHHQQHSSGKPYFSGNSNNIMLTPGRHLQVLANDINTTRNDSMMIVGICCSAKYDGDFSLNFSAIPYSLDEHLHPSLLEPPKLANNGSASAAHYRHGLETHHTDTANNTLINNRLIPA
ncbi:contractile injection system protein, VgrG/Pvc8 family [Serratia microhaemolytica]|uniref:contractile injection system protein, VgrG/Pvc8 family n=1 Tax=Serratia microhaemolytica TaxID=2675110 RepID=UPI000FDD54CB|nr:contractile injection system protein, VgrG/Pvc8 family [Serratia microhaemolytica]